MEPIVATHQRDKTISSKSLLPCLYPGYRTTSVTSSTKKNLERCLQVHSLPSLSLYYSQFDFVLPPPKKTITAPDGTEVEDMLQWVGKRAMDKKARKVMEKELCASDVSDQQNRLMISKQYVKKKIKQMLTIEEIEAANLNNSERLGGGERQAMWKKRGREHEGLEVIVYDNNGRGYLLYLTRWDSSVSSVLKGEMYKEFRDWNYLAAGDLVEMWAFKDGADKLCFVIGKKLNLELSL